MENIVYTNTENVTVEISWEDYFKEIEMRKQERLKKKPTPKKQIKVFHSYLPKTRKVSVKT